MRAVVNVYLGHETRRCQQCGVLLEYPMDPRKQYCSRACKLRALKQREREHHTLADDPPTVV